MKDALFVFTVILIFVVFITFGIWWTQFKYKDCRKVGHSKTYCVMKIFAG